MESFAIVQTGGKQLRVEPKQLIDVERLTIGKDSKKDSKEVVLDKVLVVRQGKSFEVGNPYVKGAKVLCEYLGEKKGPKTVIFKLKRRKNYRRKKGHRQIFSELRIKEIQLQEA